MEGEKSITVEVHAEDCCRAWRFALRASVIRIWLVMYLGGPLIVLLSYAFSKTFDADSGYVVLGIGVAVFFMVFPFVFVFNAKQILKKQLKEMNATPMEVEFLLRSGALEIQTKKSSIVFESEDVFRFRENENFLILWRSSLFYVFVPKKLTGDLCEDIKRELQLS